MSPRTGNAAGLAFAPSRRIAGLDTTNALLAAPAHSPWTLSDQRVAANPL